MHCQNSDRPKMLRLLLGVGLCFTDFQMFRTKSHCAISEHLNFMAKSALNKILVSVATSQTAVSEEPGIHEDFPGSPRCDTGQRGD